MDNIEIVPQPLADLFRRIDEESKPISIIFMESAVSGEVGPAEQHGELERERIRFERLAFAFCPPANGTSEWGTHFGPTFSGLHPDGSRFSAPDARHLKKECFDYWKQRANDTLHPVLRARYADLVWDLQLLALGNNPDFRFARIATEALCSAVERDLFAEPIFGVQFLKRALHLATTLNDPELKARVRDAMFALYPRVALPRQAGCWYFLFDCLYGNKKVDLSDVQQNFIIDRLEVLLGETVDSGALETFDPTNARKVADRLARHYTRANRPDEVARVIRAAGKAIEASATSGDSMVAIGRLQEAQDLYRNRGLAEDLERIQLTMSSRGVNPKDFSTVITELEIDQDKREEFLAFLTQGTLQECLIKLVHEFIPSAKDLRDDLAWSRTETPLLAMIGVEIVAPEGHIAARAGSVEDDEDGRMILELKQHVTIKEPILGTAIQRLRSVHDFTSSDILDFLSASPIVEPTSLSLIDVGLAAYLRCDHVTAAHVLIPQIERALRRLLDILGVPTTKAQRNSTTQLKNLNDVLAEPKVREHLGEDMHFYLRTILSDSRGRNLRNRICHGMLPHQAFSQEMGDRIFHTLLAIREISSSPCSPAEN